MNMLIRLGVWMKKAAFLTIAIVCIVLIFWGILYRVLLGFTPLWMDEFTIIAVPLALVVLWLIDKSAKKPSTDEKDAKPVRGVPDAAVQLNQGEGASSSPEE